MIILWCSEFQFSNGEMNFVVVPFRGLETRHSDE